MSNVMKIVSGIGLLIGIFLFLDHGKETASIINTMASNSIKGISTLQGKKV